MPKSKSNYELSPSHAGAPSADVRIDAACRQVVAGKLSARQIEAWVRGVELTETEFRVLWLLLRQSNALDQGELAEQLSVSPAQVSGVVERLLARGLIQCKRDVCDRRRQLWSLAVKGDALVQQVASVVEREGRAAA